MYPLREGGQAGPPARWPALGVHVPRNLRYIIFGWDDLTVDLPFVQFMGVGLGHKLAWQ